MNNDLVLLIMGVLQDLNQRQTNEMDGELGAETRLFGRDGILDSVGLVSLVVAVEQAVEDKCGVAISLADEKALSQTRSPYRTVGSLAEYASRLVDEAKHL